MIGRNHPPAERDRQLFSPARDVEHLSDGQQLSSSASASVSGGEQVREPPTKKQEELTVDIGRLFEAICVLNELIVAIEKLPADERETAGISMAFVRARNNLERLTQHYAQLCSFPDALWTTAMEGGIPSPEATAETALLLKWLADNPGKE